MGLLSFFAYSHCAWALSIPFDNENFCIIHYIPSFLFYLRAYNPMMKMSVSSTSSSPFRYIVYNQNI